MTSKRLTLRLDGTKPDHIAHAAHLLGAGRLVAFPTETVYGLGANAASEEAVRGIFEAKGRPSHNPLIVHVLDLQQARQHGTIGPDAVKLAGAFWPGPLTLVVPNPKGIAASVLAGGNTVGLRAPRHPVAQALLAACRIPLAAPSANRSNQLSPTTAEAVLDTLDGRIDAVLDGGPCTIGLESTVLDLATEPPKVLRPGMITLQQISWILGRTVESGAQISPTPVEAAPPLRSPGQTVRHYAPIIPLEIVPDPAAVCRHDDYVITFSKVPTSRYHGWARLSDEPDRCAAELYSMLRGAERSGARRILVERPPTTDPRWDAVRDRLQRAAAPAPKG